MLTATLGCIVKLHHRNVPSYLETQLIARLRANVEEQKDVSSKTQPTAQGVASNITMRVKDINSTQKKKRICIFVKMDSQCQRILMEDTSFYWEENLLVGSMNVESLLKPKELGKTVLQIAIASQMKMALILFVNVLMLQLRRNVIFCQEMESIRTTSKLLRSTMKRQ